jgi:Secretion system C-terminal sorting domain
MKYFISIILLFALFAGKSFSQPSPPCNYTPGWDWTNSAPGNWITYTANQPGGFGTGSPFLGNNGNTDTYDIYIGYDYLPAQGWVLLAKDFGCSGQTIAGGYPHFMLYNKYRGIIRLFVYTTVADQYSQAQVITTWHNKSINNSLLTHSKSFPLSNQSYPIANNTDSVSNYINQYGTNGTWFVTDIQTNFDPNTPSGQIGYSLDFSIYSIQNSRISLEGTFQFNTQSATIKETSSVTKDPDPISGLQDWIVSGQKYLGKVPSTADVTNAFDGIKNSVTHLDELFCNNFTRDLSNASFLLQNGDFKKYLLGAVALATGFNSGLKTAGLVLDFLNTKANTDAATTSNSTTFIQPTISNGTLQLHGNINLKMFAKNIPLQLPGTWHKQPNGSFNYGGLPYYDCPLGVISIQDLPQLMYREYNVLASVRRDYVGNPANMQFYTTAIYEKVRSYKVASNVKVALNAAAGVNIESIKAAILVEKDSMLSNTPAQPGISLSYDLFDKPIGTPPPITGVIYLNNFELESLRKGVFSLVEQKPNGHHRFSTPLIDLNKFMNTSVTVRYYNKLYLKLFVTMKPKDPTSDQTPVVYVVTYEIPASKLVADPGTAAFPLTCDQQTELIQGDKLIAGPVTITQGTSNGVIIETKGDVTVNAQQNVLFNADNAVRMTTGFNAKAIGTATYDAKLGSTGLCLSGTNALDLTEYFSGCNPAPHKMGKSNAESNAPVEAAAIEAKMYVTPNPNNGSFSLLFNTKMEAGTILVQSIMGQVIFSKVIPSDTETNDIALGEISKGIYFVTYHSNSGMLIAQKMVVE